MWGLLWDYFNALCLYYVGGGSTMMPVWCYLYILYSIRAHDTVHHRKKNAVRRWS